MAVRRALFCHDYQFMANRVQLLNFPKCPEFLKPLLCGAIDANSWTAVCQMAAIITKVSEWSQCRKMHFWCRASLGNIMRNTLACEHASNGCAFRFSCWCTANMTSVVTWHEVKQKRINYSRLMSCHSSIPSLSDLCMTWQGEIQIFFFDIVAVLQNRMSLRQWHTTCSDPQAVISFVFV